MFRMLQLYFPSQSTREEIRFQCMKALNGVYEEFKVWTDASPSIVAKLARRHVLLYHELGCLNSDPRYWHMYSKHHIFIHACELTALWGNPAKAWNYAEEREIGKAAKAAGTLHPATVSKCNMERYRLTTRIP